jgi:imidazolonepropionase-like amidohydrolase
MTRRTLLLSAATALALAAAPSALADSDLYVGVTVLDPEAETRTPDTWLLVEDGLIAAIGAGAPPPDVVANEIHDLAGLYALPGLIDTHAHLTLGPVSVGADASGPYMDASSNPDIAAHNARLLLAYGVTTVRNPGGDVEGSRDYARRLGDGEIVGPEMLFAGPVIDRAPLPLRGLADIPTPERGVGDIAREHAAAGVDYIKLYMRLSEADVAEGIEAAHAAGLPVIAHLDDVSWMTAARLGVDALVHMMPTSPDLLPADAREAYAATARGGPFDFYEWYEAADLDAPAIAEMLASLEERRIHLDATLIVFEPAFWSDDPAVRDRDIALAHPVMLENWRTVMNYELIYTPDDFARAKAVWPKLLELTRRAWEAGVPMTIGTDLGNPYVAPGVSMSREMALHVEAGVPAWAVLRMATSDAADILGIGERTGRIAEGKEADVAFLAADPSADVANAARVRAILNNGALLQAADLIRGTTP